MSAAARLWMCRPARRRACSVPALGLGDQLLDERPQFLGLRFGRLDRALLDERGREIAHAARASARWCGAAARPALRCRIDLLLHVVGRVRRRPGSAACPNRSRARPSPFSSNRIPKFSPSRSSRSAISWSDFLPKFLTCRIWLSVCRTRSPSDRMFEFLSEFTDRTDSSRSSIGVLSSCARRAASASADSADGTSGAEACEPKSDEVLEVRLRQRGGVAHRLVRRDRAVRLDGEREAVVVGALTDAGLGDREVGATHRDCRSSRCARGPPGSAAVDRMLVGLDVAAALVDVQLDREVAVVLQREEVVRPVDDAYAARAPRCRPAVTAPALDLAMCEHRLLHVVVERQGERLEVADDLVDVLDDAGDRLVLVHARRRCGSPTRRSRAATTAACAASRCRACGRSRAPAAGGGTRRRSGCRRASSIRRAADGRVRADRSLAIVS